jgi:hypothetical protein
MLKTFLALGGMIVGAIGLWEGARLCLSMVGGWRGLRHNPWVWKPLVGSVVAFGIAAGAALFVDHAKAAGNTGVARVVAGWVVLIGFGCAVIGVGWAMLAGMRRMRRIEQLLHIEEGVKELEQVEGLEASDISDDEGRALIRLIAERLVTLEDLEELWRLLPPSGGVPHLEWLTREWVRARVAVLGGGAVADGGAMPIGSSS